VESSPSLKRRKLMFGFKRKQNGEEPSGHTLDRIQGSRQAFIREVLAPSRIAPKSVRPELERLRDRQIVG
jgi:hypothetical protein